jgi:hypothetical protein
MTSKLEKQSEEPSEKRQPAPNGFSTLNEKHLHASLKDWYTQPGDRLEVSVDGSIIDIMRDDLLIEIQTRSFSSIKRKLFKLVEKYPVRLVYPISREKWITRLDEDGKTQLSRRRSPKSGGVEDLFDELVYCPELLLKPNFSLEVLFIEEEEFRHHVEVGGWRRRGWLTQERQLLKVIESRIFRGPADIAALIPVGLVEPFSTKDLALAIGRPRRLAQKMVYCLRLMGCIKIHGKQGNAIQYVRQTKKRKKRP